LEPLKKKKKRIPLAKPLVRKKSAIDRLLDGFDLEMDEDVEEKNIGKQQRIDTTKFIQFVFFCFTKLKMFFKMFVPYLGATRSGK
jgi:hypothetical protein